MNAYNTAIKYLCDKFGYTEQLTCSAYEKARFKKEKERAEIFANTNNYYKIYNKPPEKDIANYKIHLLVTQYQYSPFIIEQELENALFYVGITI